MARTETRERILNAAEKLMQVKGFNGFSYQDISRPLGVKNAAIHYHFGTKADLGVALVQRYLDLLHTETGHFMQHGGSAREQIEGYIRFSMHECQAAAMICPIAAIASDYFTMPEEVREAGKKLCAETLDWLTHVLEVGRKQDEFTFEGPARERAIATMAAVQGAQQLSRFLGDEAMNSVVAQARRNIGLD